MTKLMITVPRCSISSIMLCMWGIQLWNLNGPHKKRQRFAVDLFFQLSLIKKKQTKNNNSNELSNEVLLEFLPSSLSFTLLILCSNVICHLVVVLFASFVSHSHHTEELIKTGKDLLVISVFVSLWCDVLIYPCMYTVLGYAELSSVC